MSVTTRKPANRLGLDYQAEAKTIGTYRGPIIDCHTHINGEKAAAIYKRARDLYGVSMTYSMSKLEAVPYLTDLFEGTIRFIAVPDYMGDDRRYNHGPGFLKQIEAFHAAGSRIVKFWAAPRGKDFAIEAGEPDLLDLESPWRIKAAELATEAGMMLMAHVADPDTWFATKYADADRYWKKIDHYAPLERMLERFPTKWLVAHMGGWPEDLAFLDRLLERHPNLHLDTSATKWMVRELSKHSRNDFVAFLTKWKGRILFGSDIVTADEHLTGEDGYGGVGTKASSEHEAFELYASRYWALRTLFETEYDGESPIADPDLMLVDPEKYGELDAPPLRGKAVPQDVLRSVYHEAATELLLRWEAEHP
jgi:hypothetical protein